MSIDYEYGTLTYYRFFSVRSVLVVAHSSKQNTPKLPPDKARTRQCCFVTRTAFLERKSGIREGRGACWEGENGVEQTCTKFQTTKKWTGGVGGKVQRLVVGGGRMLRARKEEELRREMGLAL